MRRTTPALAAVCLLAAAAGTAQPATVLWNGQPDASAPALRLSTEAQVAARLDALVPGLSSRPAGGAIRCRLEDGAGNPVTTVIASRPGDPAYWLSYLNDGNVDRWVRFVVTPAFEGSPLAGQVQVFSTRDACNIETPFGIPFWGLDLTSGPWVLVVTNDRGLAARCDFDVVP